MKSRLHIADQGIKSRIVIIVMVIFAFFIVMSLIFSVYSLEARTENEMEEYRKSETLRTEEALKSYVHIAYTAVETNYKNATDVNYLSDYYGDRLRNLVDVAEAVLQEKAEAVRKGSMSKAKAQKQAIEIISNMSYDNGTGYFFIFTNDQEVPRMIVEPFIPELNGTALNGKEYNNARGTNKNIFRSAVEILKGDKEGFIDYIWPKPSGNSSEGVDIAKFSYVRIFEGWDWVIGTGIYLDDAIKDCMKKSKSDLRTMRYDNGTGYYWINDNLRPTPRLVMNPFIPQLEGQILTDKKYNRAYDEDYNLYEAFLDACEENGDGTVQYKWDKPVKGGILEDAQKTSYVKYFKPLGWVIGSGLYIDDIDKAVNAKLTKMEDEKQSLIVNYLLISLTLAGISIGVLVYLMNRYFRKLESQQNDEPETEEDSAEKTTETDDATNNNNVDANPSEKDGLEQVKISGTNSGEDVSRILEVVLKEQTRQMALSKISEKELQEKSTDELQALRLEIKNLISEVKASGKE